MPSAELVEPDWWETFPNVDNPRLQKMVERCRMIASREWQTVVPVLKHTAGLAAVDATALHDYCVVVARIDQCERALATEGLLMAGERGMQKNGHTTIVAQYRTQRNTYLGHFGLTPSARAGMTPPGGDDDDDNPFD
ncbi:phage terminase small subunit P27 family [Kibdelosporangium aridum]|uniref:Phage terminase small subunit P27 family n=1 Tax=Kibdelosporangium aridum TaxID=2030 RepID=A0A428YV41_KIBAR|nr:phage terminase small subunit P27 family [Kibdelosporangium aridum]